MREMGIITSQEMCRMMARKHSCRKEDHFPYVRALSTHTLMLWVLTVISCSIGDKISDWDP